MLLNLIEFRFIILAIVFALFLPNWLSIGRFDILMLAVALAPLALLRTFHANMERFGNPQSIVFTKYNPIFRLLSAVLLAALFYGLYKYVLIYGIWKAVVVLLFSALIQAPFYALLKMRIEMEVLLYPVGFLAVILFFVIAL